MNSLITTVFSNVKCQNTLKYTRTLVQCIIIYLITKISVFCMQDDRENMSSSLGFHIGSETANKMVKGESTSCKPCTLFLEGCLVQGSSAGHGGSWLSRLWRQQGQGGNPPREPLCEQQSSRWPNHTLKDKQACTWQGSLSSEAWCVQENGMYAIQIPAFNSGAFYSP